MIYLGYFSYNEITSIMDIYDIELFEAESLWYTNEDFILW